MYLIHGPDLAVPDIPTIWKKMEKIHDEGLAKSVPFQVRFTLLTNLSRGIGMSNFNVPELRTLLASARIKPVANQVSL